MFLANIFSQKKYKFIFFGIINTFITIIVLQIFLLLTSSIYATLISQIVNSFLGYYLYGSKVFQNRKRGIKVFLKYLTLYLFLWNLNWLSIEFIYEYGISRNIAAVVIIPPLALISYSAMKSIIFKK